MNKDLSLLTTLAIAFIHGNVDSLSDEAIATIKDIVGQLDQNVLDESWTDDELVGALAEALENLKEQTEAYNDLVMDFEEDHEEC